jgi:hypothetical protein
MLHSLPLPLDEIHPTLPPFLTTDDAFDDIAAKVEWVFAVGAETA